MIDLHALDHFRHVGQAVLELYGSTGDATCGVFLIPKGGSTLKIIAANGFGWDHVSVSCLEDGRDRTPTWTEMEFVKRLFFRPTETAMQLHVPVEDHVSYHQHVLHLWRPHGQEIPRPPVDMVAPVSQRGTDVDR